MSSFSEGFLKVIVFLGVRLKSDNSRLSNFREVFRFMLTISEGF